MANFKPGDIAYIVESNRYVSEVKVGRIQGDFVIVLLSREGGIRLRKSRLFRTREEAEASIGKTQPVKQERKPGRTPWR